MAKSSSILITTVVSGVLTAIIIGAAKFVPGAWAWFTELISAVLLHLQSPSELPNWVFCLLGVFSILWFLGIIWKIIASFNSDDQAHLSYVEDYYFGAIWRWQYSNGEPFGIWAFCSDCDTVLVYSYRHELYGEIRTQLKWETCNYTVLTQPGDKDHLIGKVYRQIDRKLRTGEWKRHVQISKK